MSVSRSALPPGDPPATSPDFGLSGRQLEAWKAEVFHDVLGTISHHVNNAFAVVMARADALKKRSGDPEIEGFLDLCIERGTEVHQLVNHLQALADSNTELLQGDQVVVRLPSLPGLGSEPAPQPAAEMNSRLVHEIKNALGGVLSTAELVQDELLSFGSPLAPPMRILLGQVGRTSCLVHLLGRSGGRGRRNETHHDPALLIEETLELLASEMADRIRVRFDRPTHPIRCRLDSGLFQAAILNVLINAVDAIPSRGTIEILLHTERGDAPHLRVEVADDGIGVATRDADRVLEPFFAMRPDGFGLGLCVAARFAQKLGGSICLDTSPGAGSRVSISIPIEPAERLSSASREFSS